MKIAGKIICGYIFISFVLIVAALSLGTGVIKSLDGNFHQVTEENVPILEAIDDLRLAGLRIVSSTNEVAFLSKLDVTGVREEALNAEDDLIREGIEHYKNAMANYENAVADIPRDKAFVGNIQESGKKLIDTALLLKNALKGMPNAELFEMKEKLEEHEQAFLKATAAAKAHEVTELEERHNSISAVISDSRTDILIIGFTSFVLSLFLGMTIAKLITRPIRRLEKAIKAFGEDGRVVDLSVISGDETGELTTSFNKVTADLTSQKQKLETQNKFLHTILDSIHDAVMIIDARSLNIVNANAVFLREAGLNLEDVIGKSCYAVSCHLSLPCYLEGMSCPLKETCATGEFAAAVHEHVDALGGSVYVEVETSPIKDEDGKVLQVVHSARDITTQKRAEEKIRESENRFQDITAVTGDWIWEIDTEGRYTYSSPAIEKILGYSVEETLKMHFYDFYHPDDSEKLKKDSFQILGDMRPFNNFLNRNVHKDGRTVYIETTGVPLLNDSGRLIGYRGLDRDITAQKVAEDSLKENEQYFRSFTDSSQDSVCHLSESGQILNINPAGLAINEYPDALSVAGTLFTEHIVEGREKMEEAIKEALTGQNTAVTCKSETQSGKEIWWDSRLTPITDIDGSIRSILVVSRDITEQKELQDSLQYVQSMLMKEHDKLSDLYRNVALSKREWEATMNRVDDIVMLVDKEGKVKRHNRALEIISGETPDDITGRNWEDFLRKHGLSAQRQLNDQMEMFHEPTNRFLLMSKYPFEDSELKFSGQVITLHDTTEIRQMTEEVEKTNRVIDENRKKLQAALEEVSILIQEVTKNTDRDIRFSNPHLITCYEEKKCGKTDCVCHGEGPLRCWQTAGTYCGGVVQGAFARKYGNCSECSVFKTATADPSYQIGEQFNNMMHVLEVKNGELKAAYDELKSTHSLMLQREKMASIGQLAAGVAHEINNPMSFIKSNIGSLGTYVKKIMDFVQAQSEAMTALGLPEVEEQLGELRKKIKLDFILGDINQLIEESLDGTERVKKIVHNLKSFSRVDEAEYKAADINECMESTLNIVCNELKYKSEVYKEYGELPLTKCYPQQLNQVFMNILINASEAIDDQGEIRIKTWNGNGYVNVSISDTGEGIPEDRLNRIFEPFFTTKPVGKGTGLGLSITYDIIKKHNGELHVESELGKGTIFSIKIPVVQGNKDG
jgi:PAS domain S-box-containing protein